MGGRENSPLSDPNYVKMEVERTRHADTQMGKKNGVGFDQTMTKLQSTSKKGRGAKKSVVMAQSSGVSVTVWAHATRFVTSTTEG